MKNRYILKTRHVNSKSLLRETTVFINEIIDNFNIRWENTGQRDAVLEVMGEHLEDLCEQKKITQWNIICDSRNNKNPEVTHLDITYRQRNCFNVTELNYEIKNK